MININLKCQYDEFNLEVNEDLPNDKIIGLFGHSGCGKSRLIRQILGFDQKNQRESSIQFASQVWQDKSKNILIKTENRGIGYLPQSVDLFPHLSCEKNIQFAFKNRAFDDGFYQKLLVELDIKNLTQRFPSQLSGGQKQRVGLARAILTAQNLLVLDEPFSAIDEDHKTSILKLLKDVNQNKQLPIIFTSHDRYEHAFLTDYLLCLDNGKVTISGDYSNVSTDISKGFAQQPDAINHITAIAEGYNQTYSLNQLSTNEQTLWAGYSPIEKNKHVNLELRAKDISVSLEPMVNSSMLNSIKTTLTNFHEIPNHQYLLKLKFNDCFLIAFITKKSFIDLGCHVNLTLYASFKSVNVISI